MPEINNGVKSTSNDSISPCGNKEELVTVGNHPTHSHSDIIGKEGTSGKRKETYLEYMRKLKGNS